jgi:hypothetical protein
LYSYIKKGSANIPTNEFPIDLEIIHKLAHLPTKLSELSYKDPETALQLLRAWGEGKKPITPLWDETLKALDHCGVSNLGSESNDKGT